jgi:hypothetical protein
MLALMVFISGLYAHGQSSCSTKSLQGSFGFSISGKIVNTGVDCAINGRFAADGKGQMSGSLTESAGGKVMHTPFKGTYSVTRDCTGSLKFNFPNGLAVGSTFVMVGNGDQMYFMNSDDASAVPVSVVDAGVIKKQQHTQVERKCSNADFQGVFGITLSGTKVASNTAFVTGGRVIADGKGHATGIATQTVAGHISQGHFEGSYKVNPDCTGSGTFATPSNTTEAFDFVVVAHGNEIFFIGTDEGVQQTGTASKQLWPGSNREK